MAESEHQAERFDSTTLAALRARLETERVRLQQTIASLATESGAAAPEDALSRDPRDFGDMGSSITEEDTELALSANDQRLLAQVERALQRMDEGSYGLSEVTGESIPLERLEALPWATTTVNDAVEG